jgi:hypothetical protein
MLKCGSGLGGVKGWQDLIDHLPPFILVSGFDPEMAHVDDRSSHS